MEPNSNVTFNLGDGGAAELVLLHLEIASALLPLEFPTTETEAAEFDQFVLKNSTAVTLPESGGRPELLAVGVVPQGSCKEQLGNLVQPHQWCAYMIPERMITGWEASQCTHGDDQHKFFDECTLGIKR